MSIGKPAPITPPSFWAEKKRLFLVVRNELLRVVGSAEGQVFDSIRRDWTLVRTRKEDWDSPNFVYLFVNNRFESQVASELDICHAHWKALCHFRAAHTAEDCATFDYEDLLEIELEKLPPPKDSRQP